MPTRGRRANRRAIIFAGPPPALPSAVRWAQSRLRIKAFAIATLIFCTASTNFAIAPWRCRRCFTSYAGGGLRRSPGLKSSYGSDDDSRSSPLHGWI